MPVIDSPPNISPISDPNFERETPEGWTRDADGTLYPPNAVWGSESPPVSNLGVGQILVEGVGDFGSGATADDIAGGPGAIISNSASPSPTVAAGIFDALRNSARTEAVSGSGNSPDWRVRVALAQGSNYLYNGSSPGILEPLRNTNGVIFPYTPSLSVSYSAAYESADLVHSNYRIYFYRNSQVSDIMITGDFTAQDTVEARYILAVIHFFRTVTKMFYGQDSSPVNGTPPPLVYLSGYGTYQFDTHPMLITNFTMTLPDNVDYIRVSESGQQSGYSLAGAGKPVISPAGPAWLRLLNSGLNPGATAPRPAFSGNFSGGNYTYIPTSLKISITAMPVVSRNAIANEFSVERYASGSLLRGSQSGGGIW